MEWLSDRTERNQERGQRGCLDFLLLLPLLLISLPLVFWLFGRLHGYGCPAGTFLAGAANEASEPVAFAAASVSLAALGRYWLIQHISAVRETMVLEADDAGRRRFWYVLFFGLFVAGLAWEFYALRPGFCLGDSGILYRETGQVPLKAYGWDSVVVVNTSCARLPNQGFRVHYDLILRDGHSFNAARSVPDFERGYRGLRHALAGQNIAFGAQGVDSACGYRRLALLTQKP